MLFTMLCLVGNALILEKGMRVINIIQCRFLLSLSRAYTTIPITEQYTHIYYLILVPFLVLAFSKKVVLTHNITSSSLSTSVQCRSPGGRVTGSTLSLRWDSPSPESYGSLIWPRGKYESKVWKKRSLHMLKRVSQDRISFELKKLIRWLIAH